MKKSLSVIVASAMAFSAFASAAFADTMTAQQKFDALKQAGIFNGYPDGSAGLSNEMTRAEFAKVLALLEGLDTSASASSYTDVATNHWAKSYIAAVTEAGLMNGVGGGKFDPNGKVTIEQVAKVADLVANIQPAGQVTGASKWAEGYVAAAVQAGLIPQMDSYTINAKRELLVDVAYTLSTEAQAVQVKSTNVVDSKTVEVTFTDGKTETVKLDTALVAGQETAIKVTHEGQEYTVKVTYTVAALSAQASQTDAGTITVKFNRALTADEKAATTFDVKDANGTAVTLTSTTWADDNMSAVLVNKNLSAGVYTVTPKGLSAVSVTITDAVATKIDITATSMQQAENQDPKVVVYNQFGAAMKNRDLNITVYDSTEGKSVTNVNDTFDLNTYTDTNSNGKLDSTEEYDYKVGDTIIVTAIDRASGLNATKSFTLAAGSAATSLKFGTPTAPEDASRIMVNQDGVVVPYTFADQYGSAVTIKNESHDFVNSNDESTTLDGITFTVSDNSIISAISFDSDGVMTISTGTNSGTAVIIASNSATGAVGSVSLVVNDAAKVGKFTMSSPSDAAVVSTDVKIPFSAVDIYGNTISASDISLTNASKTGYVQLIPSDASKVTAGYPYIDSDGYVVYNFNAVGKVTINAYVDGDKVGSIAVDVKATPAITSVEKVTGADQYMEVGATQDFDTDNVLTLDALDREDNISKLVANSNISIVNDTGVISLVTDGNGNVTNIKANKTGKATIEISDPTNANADKLDYTFTVINQDDIKSYTIDTIGSSDLVREIDNPTSNNTLSLWAMEVSLSGVYNSKSVTLVDNGSLSYVTADGVVANVYQSGGNYYVYGVGTGKSTITAYDADRSVLATKDITVSDAAPIVKSVSFDFDSTTMAKGNSATVVVNDSTNAWNVKTIDQYDVAVAPVSYKLLTSNSDVVSVSNGTFTAVAAGTATLTFVSSNGVTGTVKITVQ